MDKRIEDLMVEAILTSHTCGEGCWYAREKVCRCSCGGKNHGCLLVDGAEKPTRTSRIDGEFYELAAVGKYANLYAMASKALVEPKETANSGYKFYWSPTEKGSPVRLKAASKAQLASWTELTGVQYAYLLWRKKQVLNS